jgi:hypothetical protein
LQNAFESWYYIYEDKDELIKIHDLGIINSGSGMVFITILLSGIIGLAIIASCALILKEVTKLFTLELMKKARQFKRY